MVKPLPSCVRAAESPWLLPALDAQGETILALHTEQNGIGCESYCSRTSRTD